MAQDLTSPPLRRRGRPAPRWLRRLSLLLPPCALLSLVVAVNLLALAHNGRLDLTDAGVYSIGETTRRVLQELEAPVRVTFFYDLRSKALLDAKALLERYAEVTSLVEVEAVDPALQPALARRYKVSFAGTAVFESEGRRVTVNGGSETDFTNGLIRVTAQGAQRVCFTDGHVESDPFSLQSHDHFEGAMGQGHSHSSGGRRLELHERHGMGMAREALETLGYRVEKVLLLQGPEALAGCAVVVVASPQAQFQPVEVGELQRFMTAGGRLVMLLDPVVDPGLGPVLDPFGLRVGSRLVLDPTRHYWTDPGTPAVTSYPRHKLTRNLALTFYPGAAEVMPRAGGVPDDVIAAPLVETSDDAILEGVTSEPAAAPARRTLAAYAIKAAPSADEPERKAHLVVFGDGDFATNSFFHILGNGSLFLNAVSMLAERDKLVDITPRNYQLPRVALSNWQMQLTFLISTLLMPGLLLLAGALAWWRGR